MIINNYFLRQTESMPRKKTNSSDEADERADLANANMSSPGSLLSYAVAEITAKKKLTQYHSCYNYIVLN